MTLNPVRDPGPGPLTFGRRPMFDALFILATVGFFTVAILYTHACGRL